MTSAFSYKERAAILDTTAHNAAFNKALASLTKKPSQIAKTKDDKQAATNLNSNLLDKESTKEVIPPNITGLLSDTQKLLADASSNHKQVANKTKNDSNNSDNPFDYVQTPSLIILGHQSEAHTSLSMLSLPPCHKVCLPFGSNLSLLSKQVNKMDLSNKDDETDSPLQSSVTQNLHLHSV